MSKRERCSLVLVLGLSDNINLFFKKLKKGGIQKPS